DTWRLDPFAGYDLLLIVPRSKVIDATPDVDPLAPGDDADAINNFVFKDQAMITRHRLLAGAKLQYAALQLTIEAQYAFAGSSVDHTPRSEEHTSELQSLAYLVCRLLLEKKKKK